MLFGIVITTALIAMSMGSCNFYVPSKCKERRLGQQRPPPPPPGRSPSPGPFVCGKGHPPHLKTQMRMEGQQFPVQGLQLGFPDQPSSAGRPAAQG